MALPPFVETSMDLRMLPALPLPHGMPLSAAPVAGIDLSGLDDLAPLDPPLNLLPGSLPVPQDLVAGLVPDLVPGLLTASGEPPAFTTTMDSTASTDGTDWTGDMDMQAVDRADDDTADPPADLLDGVFSRGMIRLQAGDGHSPFSLLADPGPVQAAVRRLEQLGLPSRAVYLFSRKGTTTDREISRLDEDVDFDEDDE